MSGKFPFFNSNFHGAQNSICYSLNIWLWSNCKMLIMVLSWHSSVTLAYRKRRLAGSGTIHIEVVYLFLFKKQTDKLISPPLGTQKRINVCQIEKHKIGKGKKLYFQASKMELETEERARGRKVTQMTRECPS